MLAEQVERPEIAALRERLTAIRELPPPDLRRQLRLRSGVSLRELAASVGVSPQAVLKWERGTQPRTENLDAYLKVLRLLREASA